MNELNDEVIKIFIEGWLVKYHFFSLCNDKVEKRRNGVRVIFGLYNSRLELKDVAQDRVIISIEIPKDINSKDCMSFAMKSYLQVAQVVEREKL
ncbi:hypothetical protein B9T23_00055 [Acinetobacter terrae]|uniref:hypothetical protein n=1 Tax=Acinetobacter terrae TaxID=2731247 RepID=UPI000A332980|nr:hypothetical protein [Acinetobacter terrae]OTG78528.1 hypothetical protein B9T23_00055 [Acinetobacter terrae]